MSSAAAWVFGSFAEAVPADGASSPSEWCRRNVQLPGSARSQYYDPEQTPWVVEPLNAACSGEYHSLCFMGPVQSGKSVVGECTICYLLSTESAGDYQYNWTNDKKANDRWDRRFERILQACKPVMRRAPPVDKSLGKWKRGSVIFPHANFAMQGVLVPEHLDSDTIRFSVNEEVHTWEPGMLAKAYGRTTAVWNKLILNIGNGAAAGSQFALRCEEGTMEEWEVPCPECGHYHAMHARWDPKDPGAGGLRYDAEGCRLPSGGYDYRRLESTVRYQFPCGHEARDEKATRRWMSSRGRWSAPRNPGALAGVRSFRMEGVSVDYVPWVVLIQEKHAGLAAIRRGDPEPWFRYLSEREAAIYDREEDRPVVGRIVVRKEIKKDREGMPDREFRFGALDRQQGNAEAGELPHWWGVIRDFDAEGNSQLVWEGKCLTDDDAHDVMHRHDVPPAAVVCDSGWDTTHVYLFCLEHGYNAIKGEDEASFAHKDRIRRIFSTERPLVAIKNVALPEGHPGWESLFWLYSKQGIRERLHWLRGSGAVRWDVAGDASKDYLEHMEAEELQVRRKLKDNQDEKVWVRVRKRNDLFVCECYIAMLAEMAGLVGAQPSR